MVTALLEAEQKKMFFETERLRWRKQFELAATAVVPGARVVAAEADRLWNTVSLIMPHGENHRWVTRLDKRGVQASTGSACATGKDGPSHVLAAMGLTPEEAKRVVRFSAGWETTEEDWRAVPQILADVSKDVLPAPAVVKL
jgi:cysteine desulfurase